jgi:DNA-binding beta-propeller fold protein YncE
MSNSKPVWLLLLREVALLRLAVTALLALALVAPVGCDFSQAGLGPPADRIFLPGGIVPDPESDVLYVVNSNSDLRYNAGTVVAVDLARAAARRAGASSASFPMCAKTRFSREEPVPSDYCCWDLVDSDILNCEEPQFIQSNATVQLGSFGGAVRLQRYHDPTDGSLIRRLFVVVRAEPSITFIDAKVSESSAVSMLCTGPRGQGPAASTSASYGFCDENWKIVRPGGATPGQLVLPEEPHVAHLDESLGALFVGHLTVTANMEVQGGGISSIDICAPADPTSVRFAGLTRTTFLPAGLSQAVGALSAPDPSTAATQVYATSRDSFAVSGMVLRDPSQPTCTPDAPVAPARDLTLVPAESFYAATFLPNGIDIRGILFDPARQRAFVLHRNQSDARLMGNPSALVMLDRAPLANGQPANRAMTILPVCNGPTEMQMHDAGLGNRIYITCYDDGQIFVVDPEAFVISAIIEAGAGPTSLVFPPHAPTRAYVASFVNSHLSVIDLAPGSPTENRVVQRIGLPHGYGE